MSVQILIGDCLESVRGLPDQSVNCCVTSPPYFGLRDYGHAGQIGLESTPDEFIAKLVAVFREVKRVLRDDGTLWVNIGDSYNGSGKGGVFSDASAKQATNRGANISRPMRLDSIKPKDLIGIPWMLAFALRADGWYLRQDIIWSKPNPMPESVTDRCTKAHEYIFLLSKSPRYYFDSASIAEDSVTSWQIDQSRRQQRVAATGGAISGGTGEKISEGDTRNKRSVWNVATKPFSEAHFATFPPDLIEPAILAGCPVGGSVLDPFGGAGTTGLVCDRLQRDAILCELNPAYAEMARKRILNESPLFAEVA